MANNTKKTKEKSNGKGKGTSNKQQTEKKGNTAKKSNTKKSGSSSKKRNNTTSQNKLSFYELNRPKIALIYLFSTLLLLCITFIPGFRLWVSLRGAFYAFFGFGLFFLDLTILILTVRIAANTLKRNLVVATISSFLISAVASAVSYLCVYSIQDRTGFNEFKENLSRCIEIGLNISSNKSYFSGGILGAVLGGGLLYTLGKVVAFIVLAVLLIALIITFFDVPFSSVGNVFLFIVSGGKSKLDRSRDALAKKHSENAAHRTEVKKEKDKLKEAEREAKRRRQRQEELDKIRAQTQEKIDNMPPEPTQQSQEFPIYDDEPISEIPFDFETSTERFHFRGEDGTTDSSGTDNSYFSGGFTNGQVDDFDFSSTEIESDFDSFKSEPFTPEMPTHSKKQYSDSVFSSFDESKVRHKEKLGRSSTIDVPVSDKNAALEPSVPETDPDAFSDKLDDVVQAISDSTDKVFSSQSVVLSDSALSESANSIVTAAARSAESIAEKNRNEVESAAEVKERKREYSLPSIDFLSEPDFSRDGDFATEMKQTAAKLVDTLKSFGVETMLIGVSRGPSVTRYELQPAPGVKISKITNLADDIALNLASSGVRIEAPIPNKSAVGIEIPNRKRSTVTLREIISSSEFKRAKSKLNVALGKDITGNVACCDLAKMPHLLIAGTTGSGKSVCLNGMIVSILYNAKPSEVKLLMIDPKQVEFSIYNGIPHLLVPVISDVRKAAASLAWAVSEMDKRYRLFATCGVRNMADFNKYVLTHPEYEPMPQVVIFIDELNDLMMVSPKEVEDSVCRLAQKARAAGMHLVVATQRPSVDVITGVIKANIPSRLSLSVSSQVDSRTVLDTIGAEKLLGNGDMLFKSVNDSKPTRIQGAYVSDGEIEKIVDFLKNDQEAEYDDNIMDEIEQKAAADKKQQASASAGSSVSGGDEDMIEMAIEVAVEAGTISTSYLQRKLKIGYSKAARIVDELDEMGLIGPSEGGSKPRKFLMTKVQLLERKANQNNTTDGVDNFDIFSD